MAEGKPIVEMRGIHKTFGAVHALRGVDLMLHQGEVLGLVGDNAAGKSTLMKVLSGAYIPDSGEIYLAGRRVHVTGPEEARRLGIEMVYQDFALADNLDVASNIFLGREAVWLNLGLVKVMNKRRMEQDASRLVDRLKIEITSTRLKVKHLSGGQRQAVAIGRATAFNAKVIIMDEPTAALSVAATGKVLDLIRELRRQGSSIIVISHRLEDIFEAADRVMVLRHGRKVGDLPIAGSSLAGIRERVVSCIVGAVDQFAPAQEFGVVVAAAHAGSEPDDKKGGDVAF
jgi:simple sugar transport system ATP-binding protein